MDVDLALTSLGKFGRWQMIKYTFICLSVTVSGCWHMMVIVFTGDEPVHHCKIPAGQSKNETIPLEVHQGKERYSRCLQYTNLSLSNATRECDNGWFYDTYPQETTIVTEWDLVCSKNYLSEMSQSVFNFGVMVGAVVFTVLADRIGRKPVHLGCQYAMVLVGLAIAFAPDYITFVILRFLLGAIREGAGLVGIVMACELFPATQRTFAGAALELFWAGSWMVLSLLAYLVKNWRYLQLTVTIPPVITVALIWLLPESIPWLVANGRIDEAKAILLEAADYNGVVIPEDILSNPADEEQKKNDSCHADVRDEDSVTDDRLHLEMLEMGTVTVEEIADNKTTDSDTDDHKPCPTFQDKLHEDKIADTTEPLLNHHTETSHQSGNTKVKVRDINRKCAKDQKQEDSHQHKLPKHYTCLDILRSRIMVLYTFLMCTVWFASGVIYYGLSLGTSTMPGGKYINFFLSGAVEAPAYGISIIVLQKYGRRWPLFIFHMVAAVVLFINVWLPDVTASGINLVPLAITLTTIGKFAMTAAFCTAVLYAPEIYPTNLRNLGFGLASVWGRIGGMIAPFAVYTGKIVSWIPGLVFSIIAVVAGAGVLFLPETLNRPLPDTIEEIESWKRSGGYKTPPSGQTSKSKRKYQSVRNFIIRDKHCNKVQDETVL